MRKQHFWENLDSGAVMQHALEHVSFKLSIMAEARIYSRIVGTGSYLPTEVKPNAAFLQHEFYDEEGQLLAKSNAETIDMLFKITGIAERRYAKDDVVTSDISYFAAKDALESSGIDPETLDYIIVAHNFGDVQKNNKRSDFVPSLASRVKHKLGIKNPFCVAYDVAFGCPGWVQGMIQTDYFLKSGDSKRGMVIGAETLSRVMDPHDRNCMLYSDGAGAVILEGQESETPTGILAHLTRTDADEMAYLLWMAESDHPEPDTNQIYLKMNGRKLYKYALNEVPLLVKACLEKAGLSIEDVDKVLIHQANGKMDEAILTRLFELYGISDIPEGVMPMTISWLGNSSVATVPTLLDLILKGKLEGHEINPGDIIVFSSVGAGMNINTVVYRVPTEI